MASAICNSTSRRLPRPGTRRKESQSSWFSLGGSGSPRRLYLWLRDHTGGGGGRKGVLIISLRRYPEVPIGPPGLGIVRLATFPAALPPRPQARSRHALSVGSICDQYFRRVHTVHQHATENTNAVAPAPIAPPRDAQSWLITVHSARGRSAVDLPCGSWPPAIAVYRTCYAPLKIPGRS